MKAPITPHSWILHVCKTTWTMLPSSAITLRCSLPLLCRNYSDLWGLWQLKLKKCFPGWLFTIRVRIQLHSQIRSTSCNECASSEIGAFKGWVLAFRVSFLLSQYGIRGFCLVVLIYLTITAAFFTTAWSKAKNLLPTFSPQTAYSVSLQLCLPVVSSNHAIAYVHITVT